MRLKEWRLVVTITAETEEEATQLRDEIVGAIEDNRESGEVGADADVGELEGTFAPAPSA